MNKTRFVLIFASLFIFLVSSNSYAATESTSKTTINRLISYNQYGGGDVIFTVNNPTSGCYGYWIAKSDAGFEANLSMILAAYHSKAEVRVNGLNDQRWNGSSNFWCKLYAIEHID
ncbi:hypothetical protein K0625_11360 [Shewanella sp. NR704-98]|uniref:Uncharacterized protein n=2 Tax=Shewanella nanhaiensis TaxID=2864872 RepID=A0ABS7E3R7_9GAMM|nr:hypothetical protein [Shewanella nanhaiensis]